MSIKIIIRIWPLKIAPDEKLVLMAYADHAHEDGANTYPAVMTVAEMTGYSERSVQYITRKLVRKGLLIPDGHGTHGTNKYRIPIDNNGDILSGVQSLQGANFAQVQSLREGVQPIAPGGCNLRHGGVQPIAPEPLLTVNEPLINRGPSIFSFEGQEQRRGESASLENEKQEQEPSEKTEPVKPTREEIIKAVWDDLAFNLDVPTCEDFIAFAIRRSEVGEDISKFIAFMLREFPDPKFWSPSRFQTLWPMAFIANPWADTATPLSEEPDWRIGNFVPAPDLQEPPESSREAPQRTQPTEPEPQMVELATAALRLKNLCPA